MPPYSFPHSWALDGLAVLSLWDHSFPGLGDSTGMSRYIVLSIGALPCVSRYLSYGVDYTKGQFRLSSGVVALSQMEFCLFLCVCWGGLVFLVVLFCLSGWLGFWLCSSLGCFALVVLPFAGSVWAITK